MFSKRQIRKRYRKKNSRQHIGDIDFLVKQQIHTHQKDKHQADKRHVGGGCCRDKSGKKHRRKRDKTLKTRRPLVPEWEAVPIPGNILIQERPFG